MLNFFLLDSSIAWQYNFQDVATPVMEGVFFIPEAIIWGIVIIAWFGGLFTKTEVMVDKSTNKKQDTPTRRKTLRILSHPKPVSPPRFEQYTVKNDLINHVYQVFLDDVLLESQFNPNDDLFHYESDSGYIKNLILIQILKDQQENPTSPANFLVKTEFELPITGPFYQTGVYEALPIYLDKHSKFESDVETEIRKEPVLSGHVNAGKIEFVKFQYNLG